MVLNITFDIRGIVWYWKGPAPHYFVTVPPEKSRQIKEIERLVTYGWGMIPAQITIGQTSWKTALWPRDGLYIVPIKDQVRKAESIEDGDEVRLLLAIVG